MLAPSLGPWVMVKLKVMMLSTRTWDFPNGYCLNELYSVPLSVMRISKPGPGNHKYDILSNWDIATKTLKIIIATLTYIKCFLRG